MTFTPKGKFTVDIQLDGKHVAKSPIHVESKQVADATKTTLSGPALENPLEGKETEFTVSLYDKQGNQISSKDNKIAVQIKDSNDKEVSHKLQDTKVTFAAPSSESLTVNVSVNEHPIQPRVVNVQRIATNSKAFGILTL